MDIDPNEDVLTQYARMRYRIEAVTKYPFRAYGVLQELIQEQRNTNDVFIVFRQGSFLKAGMDLFLRDLGLVPRVLFEMSEHAVRHTLVDYLAAGFLRCNAFLVLLTPDDKVTSSNGQVYFQSRPNVMLELGMSWMTKPNGTILVSARSYDKTFKDVPTDVEGLPLVVLGDFVQNTESLKLLFTRLKQAGCEPSKEELDLEELRKWSGRFRWAVEPLWTSQKRVDNPRGRDFKRVVCLDKTPYPDQLTIKLRSDDKYWRAGFVFGNLFDEHGQIQTKLPGSFCFHVFRDPDGSYGVAIYENEVNLLGEGHFRQVEPNVDSSIELGYRHIEPDLVECFVNGNKYRSQSLKEVKGPLYLLVWNDEKEENYNEVSVEIVPSSSFFEIKEEK